MSTSSYNFNPFLPFFFNNYEVNLMKKLLAVLTVLLIVGICIPAVSADEILYDETLTQIIDTSDNGTYTTTATPMVSRSYTKVGFNDITLYPDLSYIMFTIPGPQGYGVGEDIDTLLDEGEHSFTYNLNGEKTGTAYISRYNSLGQTTKTRILLFFNDWDIGTLTGHQSFEINGITMAKRNGAENLGGNHYYINPGTNPVSLVRSGTEVCLGSDTTVYYEIASSIPWKNHITVIEEAQPHGYSINLERTILGDLYTSTINIYKNNEVVFSNTGYGSGFGVWYPYDEIDLITVINPQNTQYTFPLGAGSGETPVTDTNVNIYIRNSQTGAAIANSHILINASVNGEFFEVINQTLPGGIYQGTLQPTGGGMPNPDFYRLIPTADGYNSVMPYIDFNVDGETTIYAYMDPIAGGPLDENKTFIDFFVRDLAANPISGATVNFGGYTLLTNSQGYTVFEVDINNAYTWTVSKSGYGSLTGNAVIGADDRYTVNSVLGLAVTPTTPTAIPTSTLIGPTPTLTAPTGEPVSNLLEWFAAHFGMLLGGGVEIGKIFMWLCFSVPVGVYVGKEAKAGATGFMAGAGIVTLFFVLIGWVPIWLLVLLALIIGLLYAKVFNSSDTGGGR
jgi:hypothetical protein